MNATSSTSDAALVEIGFDESRFTEYVPEQLNKKRRRNTGINVKVVPYVFFVIVLCHSPILPSGISTCSPNIPHKLPVFKFTMCEIAHSNLMEVNSRKNNVLLALARYLRLIDV